MPNLPKDEEGLLEIARKELYTAVVGDVCDQIGLRHQFLYPEICLLSGLHPLTLLAGRAMTVLEADVFQEPTDGSPFGLMLNALDELKPQEVYLCSGGSRQYALVGELMSTAMIARGAVGAVCDGYVRDIAAIRQMGFPLFSRGAYSQDQRGRGKVIDFRVQLEINGVKIRCGDVVLGDSDGVMVVPREATLEVLSKAIEKARAEKRVKRAIENGMLATDAFREYGIL